MRTYNVLIVSKAFFPENSPRSHRTTELVKALAKMGHQVKLLCPDITEERENFARVHKFTIKSFGPLKWKAIDLKKSSGAVLMLKRLIKRLTNLLFVYPDIELVSRVKKALREEANYDILISVAVPHPIHWGVASARNDKHKIAAVWVADCGDPFMGQENDTFKYPFYFSFVEKWFCRKADFITVPTEGAIAAYYPEFHHKIKVIPQGFNFEEKFVEVASIRKGKKIAFAYAGLFIPGRRDPGEFLTFLINSSLDFEFHIFTPSVGLVLPFVKKDKQNRIILHEFIPRLQLLSALKQMDFVVNFENVGSKQTPSKLIDYYIVRKPILSIKTGQLDTTAVKEFMQLNFSKQYVIDSPEKYKIEYVAQQFLSLNNVDVHEGS